MWPGNGQIPIEEFAAIASFRGLGIGWTHLRFPWPPDMWANDEILLTQSPLVVIWR